MTATFTNQLVMFGSLALDATSGTAVLAAPTGAPGQCWSLDVLADGVTCFLVPATNPNGLALDPTTMVMAAAWYDVSSSQALSVIPAGWGEQMQFVCNAKGQALMASGNAVVLAEIAGATLATPPAYSPPPPPPPPPPVGNNLTTIPVAMFGSPTPLTAWATQLGKPVAFMPQAVGLTPNWNGDTAVWFSGSTSRTWMISVGLCFNNITLTEAAASGVALWDAGAPMDANWGNAASCARWSSNAPDLTVNGVWAAANQPQTADVIYLRAGWEMSGNWYPWGSGASDQAASFGLAFQRCVEIFRGVLAQPDANGKTTQLIAVFNPNGDYSTAGYNLDMVYPGDACVDMIAIDCYDFPQYQGGLDANGQPNLTGTQRFGQYTLPNLQAAASYAQAHGKTVGVCEFGAGQGGDNPDFINGMAAWATTAPVPVGIMGYWDGTAGSGYNSQLENQYPLQMAAYVAAYGV